MHQRVQKRKIKNFFKQLILPIVLFVLTFGVCALLFHPWIPKKVVVPVVFHTMSVSNDNNIVLVQEFCNQNHLQCSSIRQTDDSTLQLDINGTEHIFLSKSKNISAQLSSLQLTMNQLTIEGKQFKKLDFRFDKVVITF